MRPIERSKATYLFDNVPISGPWGEEISEELRAYLAIEHIYLSATREIITKLENLNDEFKFGRDHNPIHHISARVKTPRSIIDKLQRRGFPLSVASAREHLNDVAGVRVVCSYIDDIYTVARLLTSQEDVGVERVADYIRNPKPNGYRSLHLIVTVPVFLAAGSERIKVEVQIRTIAMDFWASLEHEVAYCLTAEGADDLRRELKSCADVIAETDLRMQRLYNRVRGS